MKKIFQILLIMILLSGLFQIRIFADNEYYGTIQLDTTPLVYGTTYEGRDKTLYAPTGNPILYGYYSGVGLKAYCYDENNFSFQYGSSNMDVYDMKMNNYTYYRSRYRTGETQYEPYKYLSGLPKLTSSDFNADSGYLGYMFLKDKNCLKKTTKYNANESFLSWTIGSNPYTIVCSDDVYVIGNATGTYFYVYYFVENPNATLTKTRGSSTSSYTIKTKQIEDKTIYYFEETGWTYYPNSYTYSWNTNEQKQAVYEDRLELSATIYYFENSESPDPVATYGLLDMHYSANINPGLIESSVDHIVSNGYDVNGNDLSGNILQIRAIPGYYTDESRELINQLNVTDFIRQDDALYVVYSDVITHENKIDLEWSQVVQHFPPGIRWFGFVPYLDPVEEVYYARGWIYEYCVTNLDGSTLIDWTRIYNTTGMPPSVTTPIVTSDNLNPDLVNAIEVINNINNNTENWYLQNIEINMTNSEGTESTSKPWWAYLLEAILGFLNNILDTILKLFQFDSFELPNFESEHQNLINNTGMFGETIQFESQIQDLISSATYTDPVLYYPGLQLEGVNLIPEVNINLNDYVNQLGLSDLQQLAYIVTDGSIYLSLFLLIKNKLMEILKK